MKKINLIIKEGPLNFKVPTQSLQNAVLAPQTQEHLELGSLVDL